jgi:hypothetical protein
MGELKRMVDSPRFARRLSREEEKTTVLNTTCLSYTTPPKVLPDVNSSSCETPPKVLSYVSVDQNK